METKISKIRFRQDTAENWESLNPVLDSGEPAYDLTNKGFKVGDGTSKWSELNYVGITDAEYTELYNLVHTMNDTLDSVRQEVSTNTESISTLRNDVTTINNEITSIKQMVVKQETFENYSGSISKIRELARAKKLLNVSFKALSTRIESVQNAVLFKINSDGTVTTSTEFKTFVELEQNTIETTSSINYKEEIKGTEETGPINVTTIDLVFNSASEHLGSNEGEFKDKVTYVDDAKNTIRIIITEPQAGESTIETFLLPKVIVRFNEETNSFEMLKSKIATLGNLDLKEPTLTYIGE